LRSKITRLRKPAGGPARLPAAIVKGHERFLRIALSMPGAEVWRSEAEGALAIRCDIFDRQILLLAQPDVFFLTDHYREHPWILIRLEKASKAVMAEAVERAWRLVAPTRLVRQRDEMTPSPHISR
jgi:hypothetical protein